MKKPVEPSVRDAFNQLDVDADGYISFEELESALSGFGIAKTREDIRRIFDAVDLNGDGRISLEEYEKAGF